MKQKKRKLANGFMAAAVILIAAAVLLFVGYTRGWFGDKGADSAALSDVRGVVTMTRNDVTYTVDGETPLRAGDLITCERGGTASIRIGEGSAIALGELACLKVTDPAAKHFDGEVTTGELFAYTAEGAEPVHLSFELGEAEVEKSFASLSVRDGAQTLAVFAGRVGEAAAGDEINWVGEEKTVTSLRLEGLSSFAIAQLREANAVMETCVSNEAIDELLAERQAEKEAAADAVLADNLTEADLDKTCTISIVCDSILSHEDQLDPAKASYVPADGVILDPVKVPFAEGESAFDALVRVCEACDIQLEYSWTPLYNAYYIEGIHQLYEFDCGPRSGWMYKVNGWFPNYGLSVYPLEDGDSLVLCYTCEGLGEDVGAAPVGDSGE